MKRARLDARPYVAKGMNAVDVSSAVYKRLRPAIEQGAHCSWKASDSELPMAAISQQAGMPMTHATEGRQRLKEDPRERH